MWEALQTLPDEAVVIEQYHVLDHSRVPREADFIVLIPHIGVGIIEVEGGRVWTHDGDWYSRDQRGGDHWIHNPIRQASRVGYTLADSLRAQGVQMPEWAPWRSCRTQRCSGARPT